MLKGYASKNKRGISRACRVLSISRGNKYYKEKKRNEEVEIVLLKKAETNPTEGFWLCFYRIRNEGYLWNHKRVYRIYCLLGLNLRRKTKKKIAPKNKRTYCYS